MNVFRVCVLYVYASTYDCVLEIGLEAYLQPCVRRRRIHDSVTSTPKCIRRPGPREKKKEAV
jgi:hypothetical protein